MHRKWMHLLFIAVICKLVVCGSFYYSIVAPGVIKSNRNYSICVTLHDADEPCTIRLGILGPSFINITQLVNVKPHESKSVDISIPKLQQTKKYKIVAEGIAGCNFMNTTDLNVNSDDNLHIYMQTDKGVYKPGDLVQFRVVILNEHLKPIKIVEPIQVQILDGDGIRVKQYKDISLNKGIYTGNFSLSEQPNMGQWLISVMTSGKYTVEKRKTFTVAKYVLPKFSVHLETANDFALQDEIFKVKVYGKYTHGNYVKGRVEVKITPKDFQQSMDIKDDNTAEFEFNLSRLARMLVKHILVEATLTELDTNVTAKEMKTVTLHRQRYFISVPENDMEFRNSKPYIMRAIVQYVNGSIVHDHDTPVYMQHGSKRYESFLDDRGVAKFMFDYDTNENNLFFFKNVSAEVANIVINYNKATQTRFCSLKMSGGRLDLDSIIELEVMSHTTIPHFTYIIVGHGSIIHMDYVQLEENQKSYSFKIIPSIEMVPVSYVYVQYVENGNLHYCEIKLTFPDKFENQISISTKNNNAKPGQEVTLNVKAQPDSRVSILAVDLSAHLLNADYNLKKNKILSDLLNDETFEPLDQLCMGQITGLLVLTNAHYPCDLNWYTNRQWEEGAGYFIYPEDGKITPIRSNFPETWIFKDLDVTNEITELSLKIPDTITTWLITAFSVNENTGFGMMDQSTNIIVFQPFFISTTLPYSIKRGEIVVIPVTIFNYYPENLITEITMNNTNGEFQLINDANEMLETTQETKYLNVPANGGKSVTFRIAANIVGDIDVRLNAMSNKASDAIFQKLKVEPEGILKYQNHDVYLNLVNESKFKSYLSAAIPSDILPNSEYLTLSVGGDVLASTLEYLSSLIQLPTGCGEQNMINLAPNILVLDYLKVVGKSQKYPELVANASKFIEIGYQKELTYRHESGGYSVFGPPGKESTWLTAYVIRFFIKAQKYIGIESDVIEKGLEFLSSHQLNNGAFENVGYLFQPAHQDKYGFTSFVLMSFLENRKYRKKYTNVIERGFQFLTSNLNNVNNTYALSIMATAFQMAKKPNEATIIINRLQTMAQEKNNRKWWTGNNGNGRTNDVEITAYTVMALLESPVTDEPLSTIRWLTEQRNKNGGFQTSQDTVVGMQALIKFSEKHSGLDSTLLKVSYIAKDLQGNEVKQGLFGVEPDTKLILQQQELPKSTRSINFEVTGQGNTFLQFSYQYYEHFDKPKHTLLPSNLSSSPPISTLLMNNFLRMDHIFEDKKDVPPQPSFIITALAKMSSAKKLQMEICFKYDPKDILQLQQTNMVILEINLPSGFISFSDNTAALLEEEFITRVELKNLDSTIVLYFNRLEANNEHCIEIAADKAHDVQKLKPSTCVMYDYYNSHLRDVVPYEIQ